MSKAKLKLVPNFMMGTKVTDPLVRYSEYKEGPYRPCPHCGVLFTHLGLNRHMQACPAAKPKRVR